MTMTYADLKKTNGQGKDVNSGSKPKSFLPQRTLDAIDTILSNGGDLNQLRHVVNRALSQTPSKHCVPRKLKDPDYALDCLVKSQRKPFEKAEARANAYFLERLKQKTDGGKLPELEKSAPVEQTFGKDVRKFVLTVARDDPFSQQNLPHIEYAREPISDRSTRRANLLREKDRTPQSIAARTKVEIESQTNPALKAKLEVELQIKLSALSLPYKLHKRRVRDEGITHKKDRTSGFSRVLDQSISSIRSATIQNLNAMEKIIKTALSVIEFHSACYPTHPVPGKESFLKLIKDARLLCKEIKRFKSLRNRDQLDMCVSKVGNLLINLKYLIESNDFTSLRDHADFLRWPVIDPKLAERLERVRWEITSAFTSVSKSGAPTTVSRNNLRLAHDLAKLVHEANRLIKGAKIDRSVDGSLAISDPHQLELISAEKADLHLVLLKLEILEERLKSNNLKGFTSVSQESPASGNYEVVLSDSSKLLEVETTRKWFGSVLADLKAALDPENVQSKYNDPTLEEEYGLESRTILRRFELMNEITAIQSKLEALAAEPSTTKSEKGKSPGFVKALGVRAVLRPVSSPYSKGGEVRPLAAGGSPFIAVEITSLGAFGLPVYNLKFGPKDRGTKKPRTSAGSRKQKTQSIWGKPWFFNP